MVLPVVGRITKLTTHLPQTTVIIFKVIASLSEYSDIDTLIYLPTAIGLTAGGSTHLNINNT
jgi:hypothetical protein